jgi:multiple sugar transport system substrate-binding protein
MWRNSLLPWTIAAAALLSVAGCIRPMKPVLTLAVNAGVEGETLKLAALEWGDKSGFHVDIVELPYANLFEKLLLNLTSKTGAYDVVMMDDPWFPRLVEGGTLVELDTPDNDFIESCLDVCRHPYKTGKFYALPYVGNSQIFFYRKDLFDLERMAPPRTWDEVLRDAGQLEIKGGDPTHHRYGYVMRAAPGNPVVADFMPLFWAYGAEMFDGKGNPTVNTPEALAALNMMLELGKHSPPGYAGFNADEIAAHLLHSTAAMSINWPAWISAMDDPSKSKVVNRMGYAPMPGTSQHAGQASLGAWVLGVPSSSRHQEQAKAFILWATSKQPMKEAATRGNPPTRKSVFEEPALVERFRAFPAQLHSLTTARPRPRSPQWNEIENSFGIALSKANAGSLTAQAALVQAQADIAAIVSRAK